MTDLHLRRAEGFIEKLLDVLVLILGEPRTVREMLELTEYKADTIHKYMDKAMDYGLVYIVSYAEATAPGRRQQPIYAMQPSPFERPNAPPPQ
jgi:hypothetical protein